MLRGGILKRVCVIKIDGRPKVITQKENNYKEESGKIFYS